MVQVKIWQNRTVVHSLCATPKTPLSFTLPHITTIGLSFGFTLRLHAFVAVCHVEATLASF
jgi:hypothetical protein